MINSYFSYFLNWGRTSPNSSPPLSTSTSMETDDETKDEVFYLVDDKEIVGIKPDESMGFYQSDKEECLRILPVKISLSQEDLVNAVSMRLTSNPPQFVQNAVARLFAPFDNSEKQDASFDSYLMNKFMDHLRDSNKKMVNIDASCHNPSNYINLLTKNDGLIKSLAAADIIFWPILHQNHWYLLIVEKQKNHFSIQCLDGYNNANIQGECLNYGQKLVQALTPNLDVKNLTCAYKSVKIPTQNRTDDGGAVICYMAEKYCQSSMKKGHDCVTLYGVYENNATRVCDYSQVRFHIARVIFSPADTSQKEWHPGYDQRKRTNSNQYKGMPSIHEDFVNNNRSISEPRLKYI